MHRYRGGEVAQEVTEVSVLAEKGAMPPQMRLLDNRRALQTFAAQSSNQVEQSAAAAGWREASLPPC